MSQLPTIPAIASVVIPAQDQVAANASFLTALSIAALPTAASARFALAPYNTDSKIISPDRKTDVVTKVVDLYAMAATYPLVGQAVGMIMGVCYPIAQLLSTTAALAVVTEEINTLNTSIAASQAQLATDQATATTTAASIAAINASTLDDESKSAHLSDLNPLLVAAQTAVTADTAAIAATQAQLDALTAQATTLQTQIAGIEITLGKTS
jgi:hypothetical protein